MDIEQLKLIIETVKSVSGDAATVAYWWIILKVGVSVFSSILLSGTVIVLAVIASRVACRLTSSSRELKNIADRLGVDDYDAWYAPDRRKLRLALDRILKA